MAGEAGLVGGAGIVREAGLAKGVVLLPEGGAPASAGSPVSKEALPNGLACFQGTKSSLGTALCKGKDYFRNLFRVSGSFSWG